MTAPDLDDLDDDLDDEDDPECEDCALAYSDYCPECHGTGPD